MVEENQVYELVGEAGFRRLVEAFYRRVPADKVLGAMYPPDDLPGAEDRLCGFLIFRFGGPQTYIEERGHPALRMRHAPFAVTHEARDHWLTAMTAALDEAGFSDAALEVLRPFFDNTATFLINRLD
ncbi:MAG: globin [Planctomycetota bacterium]|nr:globin [Planctomycetota bacterium]